MPMAWPPHSRKKVQLVQELAELSRLRHGRWRRRVPRRGSGMEPWLAVAGQRRAARLWKQLLALTREAKELNRVNGMLINKQMAHNQTVLNALRTPAAARRIRRCTGPRGRPSGVRRRGASWWGK
jgi:flagella synthesis protein FlgN